VASRINKWNTVPQLLFAYRDQVPQVRELDDDVLEIPQEVDAVILLGGERGRDRRVPELVLELVVVESRVDRDDGSSKLRAREQCHHPFRSVGQNDRDAIARPEPQSRHRRSERRRSGVDLGVPLPTAACDDHGVVGVLSHTPTEHLSKRPEVRHRSPLLNPLNLTATGC
jgi:hypothetical protein